VFFVLGDFGDWLFVVLVGCEFWFILGWGGGGMG